MNALAVRLALLISVVALVAIPAQASAAPDTPAAAAAKGKGKGKGKKKPKSLTVCKHGCKYRSIQDAVDKAKKKKIKKIKVEPGKYVEGVLIDGHKFDGLTIQGTHKNAKKVILEGKNAKGEGGPAQNGIEATNVNDLTLKNMWARNYAANGFFVRDSDANVGKDIDCNDYLMKNLYASFNRSYGMYAFQCAGGRITKSVGWGHGDSAFYIGATPIQDDPKTTSLDKLEAFENVLGYSGTNSHYVDIRDSAFYNNGVGLVPNTLDSEPFEPSADGVIRENDIFWNNFNYFLPNSRVKTVSGGLGEIGGATINYPTGVGIALFGAQGWIIRDNNIFGNFKWGSAAFSDPFNEGDEAISRNNQFLNNLNGRGGTDTNAVDFWIDGSGSGNCFSGNVSSTFDPSSGATNEQLYPTCPAPAPPTSGTGTSSGDPEQQLGDLLGYVTTDPPENQECSWTKQPHPDYKDYEPLEVTPGPDCP